MTLFRQSLQAVGALLLLLLVAVPMSSEAATYAYRSDTFSYDVPSGSATSVTWHTSGAAPACTGYPNGDDDWEDVNFPSGFAFTFGGTSYSSVRVYSNGILAFPPDNSGFHRDYTSQALPITTAGTPGPPAGCTLSAVPDNLMLVYWLDIVAGTANNTTGASVKYELLGTAPNRRFVISWVNVKLYNQTARYNFQVALYESAAGVNGNFKYQYTTGSSSGSGATVGVQLTTTDYTQYAYNQNFIDTTVGTAILWYPANQLTAKLAEYRFDEGVWSGVAGEIKDTSGNLNNASRVGNAASTSAGKICRGGQFTNNTSNTTVDAVATPIAPSSQGAIDFWYRSSAAWGANGSDAMLFDATTTASRPFFLLRRANGALRFVVTDSGGAVITAETSSTYSFAANTWQHIAVSWSFRPGSNQTALQIIINGSLVSTGATTPYRTTSTGSIAALGTIYIGDNRTSGVTPSTGSPNGANGTIDEVYIYGIDIGAAQAAADMALTRSTCTTLDHFHIVHAGEIVNCGGAVASVTIEAHDASHALISLAGSTMQLSTSTGHGTWSSITTINPVSTGPGDGTGSYTFSNESSIVLGLADTFSESVNINLVSGVITERSGVASTCTMPDYTFGSVCDADLTFAQAGFLFDVPNHVAEVAQSFTIKAVKKADNSTACVPLFANTTKNLTFTCSYSNPASGTLPVRIGGKALNAAANVATACDATGQALGLQFDATGVATTTAQYADVGKMTLNAQLVSGGMTQSGTDTFIAAPASFAFSGITAAPISAGTNFSAVVTARNNANATTPNFGQESPVREGVALSFVRYRPTGTGAVNGNFTGSAGTFSNGQATATNLNWSEVGLIDLTATLASGSYLGSGLTASGSTGTAGAVGRFIPHHFDVTVTNACTSATAFTYSGQPLNVTIKAMNGLASPTVTQNYDGSANTTPSFAKAVTLSELLTTASTGSLGSNIVPVSSFSAGVATAAPVYNFTNIPTVPTVVQLRAVDSDNVSSSGYAEGTASIRSGRLRLGNAYGSELLVLPIPLEAQYWTAGGYYARNTDDSCTSIPMSSLAMGNYLGALSACKTQITPASVQTLSAGKLPGNGLVLTAPGTGSSGSVDMTLNAGAIAAGQTCLSGTQTSATASGLTWLGPNPTGRATFGIYKSRQIYSRENY